MSDSLLIGGSAERPFAGLAPPFDAGFRKPRLSEMVRDDLWLSINSVCGNLWTLFGSRSDRREQLEFEDLIVPQFDERGQAVDVVSVDAQSSGRTQLMMLRASQGAQSIASESFA